MGLELNSPICHRWTILALCLMPALAEGCGQANSQPKNPTDRISPPPANQFDPAIAGAVVGRVVWQGEIPIVPPFLVRANPTGGNAVTKRQMQPNPNAPLINPTNHGVGNAVVFLRGVDVTKAKPWNLPPVRVEQRDLHLHIQQGDTDSRYGLVRRGDSIEMVSRDNYFHSLHLSGVGFLTLAFPDPNQPLSRSLMERGVVELTSAAGYYWMRAYIFVDDHPYYTRTDNEGRFSLDKVPPGKYEVVCWMPNWMKARHERDPESGLITRLFFRLPVERVQPLILKENQIKNLEFVLSEKDFRPEFP
jgi:hypothetical protein